MACLCRDIAGNDMELPPTCLGNLWIFQNLGPKDVEALSRKTLRKKMTKGETL